MLTGGEAITEDLGVKLENLTLDDLGRAKRVTIDKDTTTIIDGAGKKDAIEARVKPLRREIEDTTSDYDREKLQERLAKLVGGVAVINVGAATEVEMKEKKARVEDAMHATRAAVEEGIVPGGGVALIRCAPALDTLVVRRRSPLRRQHHPARARGAAAPDRAERRRRGRRRRRQGPRGHGRVRLQRRDRRLRGPRRGRRHRSDQGRARRAAERRVGRVAHADDRGADRRAAEGRTARRRLSKRGAARRGWLDRAT